MADKSSQVIRFIEICRKALHEKNLIRLVLSGYQGPQPGLQQIIIRPVLLHKGPCLSLTCRFKTNDQVENHLWDAGLQLLQEYLSTEFTQANLFSSMQDWHLDLGKPPKAKLSSMAPRMNEPTGEDTHNRIKQYHIDPKSSLFLHDLGITNSEGKIYDKGQAKFRQIQQFLESLVPYLEHFPQNKELTIMDMGSGKGYLTFALYAYLTQCGYTRVNMTGIEERQHLIDQCNQIAQKYQYRGLQFTAGRIDSFNPEKVDILIALHACDTATDDALALGIRSGAQLLVVAPCCHKQVRKAIQKESASPAIKNFFQFGVFMERQSEMLTDLLRALILKQQGYRVSIGEFVSIEHTPKNVLIIAEKQANPKPSTEIRNQIIHLKQQFGLTQHYLESKLPI